MPTIPPYNISRYINRTPIYKENNFVQAGEHYNSLTEDEKEHLADNMAVELTNCNIDIINRVIANINHASYDWAYKVVNYINKYRE